MHPDMKNTTQCRRITNLRRIKNSTYGNARWEVTFDFLDHIPIKTAPDHYIFDGQTNPSDCRNQYVVYKTDGRGRIVRITLATPEERANRLIEEHREKYPNGQTFMIYRTLEDIPAE